MGRARAHSTQSIHQTEAGRRSPLFHAWHPWHPRQVQLPPSSRPHHPPSSDLVSCSPPPTSSRLQRQAGPRANNYRFVRLDGASPVYAQTSRVNASRPTSNPNTPLSNPLTAMPCLPCQVSASVPSDQPHPWMCFITSQRIQILPPAVNTTTDQLPTRVRGTPSRLI